MMKKKLWMLVVLNLIFLVGCADKSVYYTSTPSFGSWRLWTGSILGIEMIFVLALIIRIDAYQLFSWARAKELSLKDIQGYISNMRSYKVG